MGIDAKAFRSQRPYPWVNPHGALAEGAYRTLTESLPELDLFTKTFGKQRKYGQSVEGVLQKLGFQWQAFSTAAADGADGVDVTTLKEMLVDYPSLDWGIRARRRFFPSRVTSQTDPSIWKQANSVRSGFR